MKKLNFKKTAKAISLLLCLTLLLTSCISGIDDNSYDTSQDPPSNSNSIFGENTNDTADIGDHKPTEIIKAPDIDLSKIPEYSETPYTPINSNVPFFSESEYTTASFEMYGELDSLKRCTTVYASLGKDLMPEGDRESIGMIKPSGWQSIKYDCVNGKYLYNRCHLIGWQLSAENANEKNLITGTRYLNVDGMLPFENMVADYIKETNNHVLYRVTPIFVGSELVARGVVMEGYSVEDRGEGITFCVFIYNVQPGININYADGSSSLISDETEDEDTDNTVDAVSYILNTNTKKFHLPDCYHVSNIKAENYGEYSGERQDLISAGYDACKTCKP